MNMHSLLPRKKPILTVLHQATSTPGRVGQILVERGFPLDIRRPALGDNLPETLEHHSGAVIFGGPGSANDPEPWVRKETDWLDVPLSENKPFFGICLGAQLLANHLGAHVYGREDQKVEIGWYPLEPTPEGHALMEWPSMVYHFHREGFSLPRGATLLARSQDYPNQAFRYGENAFAVQFHGELTQAMMQRWAVKGAHRFALPGAQPARAHLEGRMLWDRRLRSWMEEFLQLIFERQKTDS